MFLASTVESDYKEVMNLRWWPILRTFCTFGEFFLITTKSPITGLTNISFLQLIKSKLGPLYSIGKLFSEENDYLFVIGKGCFEKVKK